MIKICTPIGNRERMPRRVSQAIRSIDGAVHETKRGPLIAHNRNAMMTDLERYTHLLFWDSDIVATQEHVDRLLSHEKAIVGGSYELRNGLGVSIAQGKRWLTGASRGLVRATGLGAGFLLVETDVLPILFEHKTPESGEDVGFCINAIQAGHELWGDCDCRVEHLV